ncbi:hypothetical protein AU490_12135 [Lonsdalea populi]|uniref:Uncharacterized protein n=1 Tax=Lonsdalea populi TaxID=1172565 RepID=A0A3N0UTI4_9GAMM|nr:MULTISPECIES: hypothetical protein [Lonsdalea]OSM98611.1 hypothetical protein AU499_12635 [Lonsdalea populi]QPQ23643.1 hypothetical protein I6N93_13695 [Lonsdalea populi]RAT16790.1 hypothetical protein AU486_06895 [Lonsdalea quercina]RAT27268.1 hypothetical protein AU490_12135 [Lonsdalea populi]RAT30046.1 hypothetical protein AU491_16040 [Lonsdalea populi]
MTTRKTDREVNKEVLKRHLSAWLDGPLTFTATAHQVAELTGKHLKHVRRDIKRMRERRGQPLGTLEVLEGHDFLMLLASYNTPVSFEVIEALAELYSDKGEPTL